MLVPEVMNMCVPVMVQPGGANGETEARRLRQRRRSEAIVASVAAHQPTWVQQDAAVVAVQNSLSTAALHLSSGTGTWVMEGG